MTSLPSFLFCPMIQLAIVLNLLPSVKHLTTNCDSILGGLRSADAFASWKCRCGGATTWRTGIDPSFCFEIPSLRRRDLVLLPAY